jgi:hypothetical protein
MGLFWSGDRNNNSPHPQGVCQGNAKGPHVAAGHNFILAHSGSDRCNADTETTQAKWRFCTKCYLMFWAGSSQDDRHCPLDGNTHIPAGLCFNLPINRQGGPILNRPGPHDQDAWCYCGRCTSLFWNGDLDHKGVCAKDGQSHAALGDFFVLHFA